MSIVNYTLFTYIMIYDNSLRAKRKRRQNSISWFLVSYLLIYQNHTSLNYKKLSYSSGGQKFKNLNGLMGRKSRCQQGCILPQARGDNAFLPFSSSGGCLCSLACDSFVFQTQQSHVPDPSYHYHISSLTFLPLFPMF